MKRTLYILAAMSVALMCATSCGPDLEQEKEQGSVNTDPKPDPKPEPKPDNEPSYDNLDAYEALKTYVNRTASPDFKLGAAVNAQNFVKKGTEYNLAVTNFDEMTPDNAMKQSSVMRSDGTMDFSTVKNFLDKASQAGMTVYGHTLAWHSQQQNTYLNGLLKGKRVDYPDGNGTVVLLEDDFNRGGHQFMYWGNNATLSVADGLLKVSNPSVTDSWKAQFAHDFSQPFEKGKKYSLSFRIKGSGSGTLSAGMQILDESYTSAGDFPAVQFGAEWKEVSIGCTCTAAGGTRLVFSFGAFAGDIYIDDFVFSVTGMDYVYESLTSEEKKQILTDEMDRWIKAVMEVTAKNVSVWDAVNESISGKDVNGDGYYELESASWGSASNFYWQDYLGSEDYVRIVIDRARKYYAQYGGTEPLRLFINDYNLESDWDDNKKLRSLIHWIGIWESDGVTRIDGIGSQMHISYYENPQTQKSKEDHYVKMLQLMVSTGKLVKISELDMGYVDKSGNTLPTTKLTDQQHRAMADYYEFIVRKYFEIVPPSQQYGITIWCPTDAPGELGTGWRGGEPVGLWDQQHRRKYAYAGFANGLRAQ